MLADQFEVGPLFGKELMLEIDLELSLRLIDGTSQIRQGLRLQAHGDLGVLGRSRQTGVGEVVVDGLLEIGAGQLDQLFTGHETAMDSWS